jgi:hypothetical protein
MFQALPVAFLGIQHVLHEHLEYKILHKVTLEFILPAWATEGKILEKLVLILLSILCAYLNPVTT